MNSYVTGTVIKQLREKQNLTQAMLADMICVSDKTVSKWETGKGLPDISLLEPLAAALRVSVTELISGQLVRNTNTHGNMFNAKFYVCPVCGNVVLSVGEGVFSCHGIALSALDAEASSDADISVVEDELFIKIPHKMEKNDYISFICGVAADRVQLVKLYPEGNAEARIKRSGVRFIYYYDIKNGLYKQTVSGNI